MYCIDEDSIHMSGISNGGMFMYYAGKYVAQKSHLGLSTNIIKVYMCVYECAGNTKFYFSG